MKKSKSKPSKPNRGADYADERTVSLVVHSQCDLDLAGVRAKQLVGMYPRLDLQVVVARSVAEGLSTATGEAVALLNAAVEPHPNWLPALLKCAHEPMTIVGSLMCDSDGKILSAGISIDASTGVTGRLRGAQKSHFQAVHEMSVPAVDFGAALMTRPVIECTSPLDEGLGDYAEVDFCLRAGAKGASVRYCPGALVADKRSRRPLDEPAPGLRALLEQATSRDRFFRVWLDREVRPNAQCSSEMRSFYETLVSPSLEYLAGLGARDPDALLLPMPGERPW